MKFTAEQIAGILEGEVIKSQCLHVLSKIEEGKEGSLTFVKPKITTTFIARSYNHDCK
jgi:UDP-3-O-[3-hydroxymyristoyl] glucosamine N-acyltransferase